MGRRIFVLPLLLIMVTAALPARQPARARRAMVTAAEAQATDAGVAILKAGGNAVDAAVAVGFALGVTHPAMGGLGGGGYMLIRLAGGRALFIDFREKAPGAASRDMYRNPEESVTGWRASGVPGTVRGFDHAARAYGKKAWNELIQPAIDLAEKGAVIPYGEARRRRDAAKRLEQFPESKRVFLKDGAYWEPGDTMKQPELAATLRRIASGGAAEFYSGETAARLARQMAAHGGLITLDDLAKYAVAEREVLKGRYRGYDILAAPPSTAGGIGVLQMLAVLEGTGFERHGAGSAASIHVMAEVMRRFFADRNEHLGDPDFVRNPVTGLLSRKYVDRLRASIDPQRATPSERVRPGRPADYETSETTHYSVVDAEGNAVAVTYTLNSAYGSGVTVPELGFLLNNNMDNFAARPGQPNNYGLVQGEANAIRAGKRPLSSMAPTIVLRDGKLYLVTGTPGGPTITTAVLQAIVNVLDFGMNAQEAIDFPRFHHQWLPDRLTMERGFSPDTIALLKAKGHQVDIVPSRNDMMAIRVDGGWIEGAADSRREGKAAGY